MRQLRFAFASLLPGTHTVTSQLQTGWDRTVPADGKQSVTVAAGDVVLGINFGLRSNGITQNSPPVFTSTPETFVKVNNAYRYEATATL